MNEWVNDMNVEGIYFYTIFVVISRNGTFSRILQSYTLITNFSLISPFPTAQNTQEDGRLNWLANL